MGLWEQVGEEAKGMGERQKQWKEGLTGLLFSKGEEAKNTECEGSWREDESQHL